MAKLVDVPEELVPVPVAFLEAVAIAADNNTAPQTNRREGRGLSQDIIQDLITNGPLAPLNMSDPTPFRDGVKWTGTCAFNDQHEAVITWSNESGAGYKCLHNSCANYGWRELKKHMGIDLRKRAKGCGTDGPTYKCDLPEVILPGSGQPITETARDIGMLMAANNRVFIRGGVVVRVSKDGNGFPVLDEVKPAALASEFETVAYLQKWRAVKNGESELVHAICPEQTAKLLMKSRSFQELMPPIHVVTRCPILIERNGTLDEIVGYDRESGIYAGGDKTQIMTLDEARYILHDMLQDFRFATPADKARALAAIITPALVLSGLLGGRAPIDLGEADDSQSGKGYRNKMTSAIYHCSVAAITQKKGGVGSLEESFNMALIRGANFISFDNVRGKLDSQAVESFLTEDFYTARAPYREPVDIDPRRVVVMLTSNKAEMTTDLANRSSCVRILKQEDSYQYKAYPEGDILDHVRANQVRYLGAVHTVIRAWYEAGQPRTTEHRHDFRRWAQTLDWICQKLLDAGPLMDGHRETQQRMTNPALNWLRDVALEVMRANRGGVLLRTSDLLDILEDVGKLPPGIKEDTDLSDNETRKKALQAMGRKLSVCFRSGDVVRMDSVLIERKSDYDSINRRDVKLYRFKSAPIDSEPIGAQEEPTNKKSLTPGAEDIENAGCAYKRAYIAPIRAPIKCFYAPNAPIHH